jgi:hypothetical protein
VEPKKEEEEADERPKRSDVETEEQYSAIKASLVVTQGKVKGPVL